MKYIPTLITAGIFSLLMTGCTSLQTTHSNLSTEVKQQLSTSEAIVAYFSKDAGEEACSCGSTMDKGYSFVPVEHGYYRKLLGRDAQGRFLLQDFYQDSQKPQTDPFWIIDPKGLNSFDILYTDGLITAYHENGKPSFSATYRQGEQVGKAQSYYENGQLGAEYELTNQQTYVQKLWYVNGRPAADVISDYENEHTLHEGKIWDEKGQLVDNDEQKSEIISNIYKKIEQTE